MKSHGVMTLAAVVFVGLLLGASCPKKTPEVEAERQPPSPVAERPPTPDDKARALFQEGEQLFQGGDFEAAAKIFLQILNEYPETKSAQPARFRLGQCYLKLGRTEEALKQFQIYVETYRDDSDVILAQDYIIQIRENEMERIKQEAEARIFALEQENYALQIIHRYLQRSIDAEIIYVEIDLDYDRLFVKLGTQTLYEYPIITGKQPTRLAATGQMRDWSTPPGIRRIQTIEKDPVWYRPDWVWLEKGEKPPANLTMEQRAVRGTLGPYKLTLGEGYAIHGTKAGVISPGKKSHGCIRMNNKDLIQLVHLVEVGTMVYIY